jgi:hypothetical protein
MKPVEQSDTSRFTPIAYSIGLAIIFSATVLNLCLHKLEPKHLYSLPSFLVEPYERAGSLGVTVVLAGVGVFIMGLGYLSSLLSGRSSRTGGRVTPEPDEAAVYSDPRIAVPASSTSSSGAMVLETTKYLGKKPSALPGATVFSDKANK